MSPEFLSKARRFQADTTNADRATQQTVSEICDQVHVAGRDPIVQQRAVEVCRRFKGGPLYAGVPGDPLDDPRRMAYSAWIAAKLGIKFVHHEELIRRLFNEQGQLQLLIDPRLMVRLPEFCEGDCANFTELICSFLEARGVPWELVVAACDPDQPGVYSHIYPRAILGDQRLPLDASHGDYPGWHVPAKHTWRAQVFNSNGQPVQDQASWSGLHGYRSRGLGAMQCNAYDDFGACIGYYDDGTTPPGQLNPPPLVVTPPPANAPQSSWDTFLQNILGAGVKIGGQVVAPQTTIQRGPNGQLLITGPSSSVNAGNNTLLGAGTTGSTSWLLIGGLLIGGLVLMSSLKKS